MCNQNLITQLENVTLKMYNVYCEHDKNTYLELYN